MSPTPVPPFTRQDAIYFLAMAGDLISQQAGTDPRTTGRTVIEALTTLGVSDKEIRVAGAMAVAGHPSRWAKLPAAEPTEKEA